jgi:hypothetical protein
VVSFFGLILIIVNPLGLHSGHLLGFSTSRENNSKEFNNSSGVNFGDHDNKSEINPDTKEKLQSFSSPI